MSNKGWIAVDLDGTLAKYDKWKKDGSIGEPVPKMVERVKRWLKAGKTIKIMTARVSTTGSDVAFVKEQRDFIEKWCLEHIGQVLEITCEKDFKMIQLWDDRCVQVIPNTGEPVNPEASDE